MKQMSLFLLTVIVCWFPSAYSVDAQDSTGHWSMLLLNDRDDIMVRVLLDGTVERSVFPIEASVWTSKAFSADGSLMALSRNGNVIVYNFLNGQTREYNVEHTRLGDFSPDGRLLSLALHNRDGSLTDSRNPLWTLNVIRTSNGSVLQTLDATVPVGAQYGPDRWPVLLGFLRSDQVAFTMVGAGETLDAGGQIWDLSRRSVFPDGLNYDRGGFAYLPATGERVFRAAAARADSTPLTWLGYAPPDGEVVRLLEASAIGDVRFVAGGLYVAVEVGDEWHLVHRDGGVDTLPLGLNDSSLTDAPDGYVFVHSEEDTTTVLRHEITPTGVEETLLWQDDGRAHWQIVWSAPVAGPELHPVFVPVTNG